ncbi:MAG: pentapeptide repeat-containing protein, partial [Actinopolymorphaceae bacterium]
AGTRDGHHLGLGERGRADRDDGPGVRAHRSARPGWTATAPALTGSAFTGSAFTGSAFTGSAFTGSVFTGSVFTGSVFTGLTVMVLSIPVAPHGNRSSERICG